MRTMCALGLLLLGGTVTSAQQTAGNAPPPVNDYVIGSQDVLLISSFDQPDLSGKFAIDADGAFTFPMLGRVRASGMTLRQTEAALRHSLKERGLFRDPQLSVAVDEYRSQKLFILGEVRRPGVYPLSGPMRLIEALALADATLATASGEVVIVSWSQGPSSAQGAVRVDLRDLERGNTSVNVPLKGGDTILVPRAENIFVFGQVKNPGGYPLQQKDVTVLQALSLAGGVTERGAATRARIIRRVNNARRELNAQPGDLITAGDTIIVPERFF